MSQNDDGRTPKGGAERHLRVRSRFASMLGVGRLGPRSEPALWEREGRLAAAAKIEDDLRPRCDVGTCRRVSAQNCRGLWASRIDLDPSWLQPSGLNCAYRLVHMVSCHIRNDNCPSPTDLR
jgi:hypothetical protein